MYCEEKYNPDTEWVRRTSNSSLKVDLVDAWDKVTDNPPLANHLRFVCISDTHTLHPYMAPLPAGDVLIHSGDFSRIGTPAEVKSFNDYLGMQTGFKHRIVIAGNHDLTFDEASYEHTKDKYRDIQKHSAKEVRSLLTNCTYLEDSGVTIEGLSVYGTPWQPEFCNWAFNLPRGEMCQEKWDKIPEGVDVLISHGPPLGHGDQCRRGNRAGCVNLLDTLEMRVKPKVHVFGHIHEGYGVTTNGVTKFVNASSCNYFYDKRNLNPPVVFDLAIPNKQKEEENEEEEKKQ